MSACPTTSTRAARENPRRGSARDARGAARVRAVMRLPWWSAANVRGAPPNMGGMHMAYMTLSRRRLLQGAAAVGLAPLAPRGLFAQGRAQCWSTRRTPAPARRVRHPRRHRAHHGSGRARPRRRATCMSATAPSSRSPRRIEAPAAQVIDGAGMICIPGLRRYALPHVDLCRSACSSAPTFRRSATSR